MSCLSINIRDEGNHLQASCDLIPSSLKVTIKKISTLLNVSCRIIRSVLLVSIVGQVFNTPLEVSCGLICYVNDNHFLYVKPKMVWLTEDMLSGDFEIISNVSWKIE